MIGRPRLLPSSGETCISPGLTVEQRPNGSQTWLRLKAAPLNLWITLTSCLPRVSIPIGNKLTVARHRLESFITSRSEWCISRQRSWGVPIPVLFDSDDNPVTKYLSYTVDVLDRKGIDHWWTGPVEDFVPAGESAQGLYKGRDTMDVWFDSGSAWTSIDGKFGRSSETPLADVCLEGSDQHRGWFQSSLLTRLITTTGSEPVAGALITHGFVMDEQGRKMSKSDGNGISPMDIVHGMNVSTPERYGMYYADNQGAKGSWG